MFLFDCVVLLLFCVWIASFVGSLLGVVFGHCVADCGVLFLLLGLFAWWICCFSFVCLILIGFKADCGV